MTLLPAKTGAGGVTDANVSVAQQQTNFGNWLQWLIDVFGTGDSNTARASIMDVALGGIAAAGAAATTNLAAINARIIDISTAGTVAISSFGTLSSGAERTLRIVTSGTKLTLTHNATSLICPGDANVELFAGDVVRLMSLGSGNWLVCEVVRGWGDAGLKGMRNRIINGDMRIDQRSAGSGTTPTATGYYSCDRWSLIMSAASKLTIGRNLGAGTLPAGFDNYLGLSTAAAYTPTAGQAFNIVQAIEGFNVADLMWGTANAKPITLSFWAYSSVTGNHSGALRNSALNRSYPFTVNIAAANTWEYKTITIPGDTAGTWLKDSNVGINVLFNLGANADQLGAAGAWAGAAYTGVTGSASIIGTLSATFRVTGVQLEEGGAATPFERRDYGRELSMCQRYYEQGAAQRMINYTAAAATIRASTAFKVTKRAVPTLSIDTGAADLLTVDNFQVQQGSIAAGAEYVPGTYKASAEF